MLKMLSRSWRALAVLFLVLGTVGAANAQSGNLGTPPEYWCIDAACSRQWATPDAAAADLLDEFIAWRSQMYPTNRYYQTSPIVCFPIYSDTVRCSAGVSFVNSLGYVGSDPFSSPQMAARCPLVNGVRPPVAGGLYPDAYCPGGPPTIQLSGPGSTKALPAGPALPQTARVTQNGAAVAGRAVSIALTGGGVVIGNTDATGEYRFTYQPPRGKATAQLTGTCSGCSNTATKVITVEGAEVQMCPADPGSLMGNPIAPASGEKLQTETDYSDSGVHALNWVRTYRSFGNIGITLGQGWSHGYAALISGSDNQRTVRLGGGGTVLFERSDAGSAWRADNGKDSLSQNATGWLYTRASDESRWQLDASGTALLTITERNGWVMALAYNPQGQLATVTNAFGRSLQLAYNAQGQLAGVTTPDGQVISYQFDSASRLIGAGYPDNSFKTYAYENPAWPAALTGISDESGVRYASFAYDANGRAVSTSHAGGVQSYSMNYGTTGGGSGSLVAGTTIDPAIYRSTVQVTDPLGIPQTWTYQGGDGSIRVLGANGAFMGGQVANSSFVGATTLPESQTDFLGITTLFSWDAARRLKTSETRAASRPEAQTVQTQWHPVFRLPVLLTEAGRSTAYTYDALGNKLSETVTDLSSGQARSWAWTYTPQGLVASHTDPRGAVWSYTYDAQGNRLSQTNPLGHVTAWQYDGAGRPIQQTEPNGLVTTYSYDLRGRLTSASRGGETSTYTWTPTGLLASASLPSGQATSYQYDAAQRLIGATDNRGNSVAYTLDAMGNRIREEVRDAGGAIAQATSRAINSLNRVSAISGAVGQTTQLGYDANGEAISQTDPLNQTTRQSLDALRRPVATTLPDNAAATQAWNALDQLTQVTDPKGVATQYSRNAFGEVVSETSPDIGTQSYQRDAAGDIAAITDARGITTQITRDTLGRPVQVTRGAQHQTVYTWDQGQTGYLSQIEDPSGVTSYTRDALGRILSKTQTVNDNPANPASFTTRYSYQGGELASIEYPSGLKLFYQRSAAGQITGLATQLPGGTVKKPKPIVPFVSNLTHTALGQPKAWSWANGDSASRSFDSDGRMTANEFASYGYDAASRITSLTQNLWASTATTGTGTGTATGTVTLYTTPLSWTIGYDSRNRLTSFNRNGSEASYTYDANSNRLTSIDKTTSDTDLDGDFDDSDFAKSTAQALNVDPASNKLLGFTQTLTKVKGTKTVSTVSSNVAYSLDAAANLTSDGLRGFDYDNANRLSQVSIVKDGEAAQVRYLHNALGQRTFKSEPEAQQTLPSETELGQDFISWLKSNFKWLFAQAQANTSIGTGYTFADGHLPEWAVLGEYDNGSAAGKGRSEYIWLPTDDGQAIPVGMFRNGKFFAIHTDPLGTPRLMTNEANQPVWQWPYSAFGNNKPTGILKATPNPKAAITNQPVLLKATAATEMNLRFPGQYADDEAGSFYNYQRSYLASQGRYTQNDPIGLGGGWNRYAYVKGNPLRYIDPLGLGPWDKLYGLPKEFWKWLHKEDGGELMKAYKDPKTGQISKEDARELYEQWKKYKEGGFIDPSLLEGFLPWGLTPSELAPGTLWGPGTPYPTPQDYDKAKVKPICP
ncbi:MAG: hypothetical protein KF686_13320 [Ramlibacter sp.]|nr:hypothetical protein [Ramlibacter sp.]